MVFISEYLLNHGVDCFHDNIKLVTMSHIVFLCVLPSQIPAICEEIKSCVAPTLFIYSFASSCPVKKLRQLLGTTNVVRPDYIMSKEQDTIPWDYSLNVQKALEIKEIVSLTYPLSREKGENSYTYEPRCEKTCLQGFCLMPCCVLEQRHIYPRKVLVIPRKRWLRPDMAEKLLTGTLSINTNKSGFPTRSNTNQAVQTQKMARVVISDLWSRRIVLCCENKGGDKLPHIFLFAYQKFIFFHDPAHIV